MSDVLMIILAVVAIAISFWFGTLEDPDEEIRNSRKE